VGLEVGLGPNERISAVLATTEEKFTRDPDADDEGGQNANGNNTADGSPRQTLARGCGNG
jgi:hypothetical protein